MGCDIHAVIQLKDDFVWRTQEVDNPEYKESSDYRWEREKRVYRVIDNRDYDLFGILANVRNGTWGEPTPFIDEPRGFPKDFKCDSEDTHCGIWMGDHSFSWLSLKEILDFEWDKKHKHTAYVSKETAEKMDKDKSYIPESFAGWSSNGVVRSWDTTLRDMVSPDFFNVWIPLFKKLHDDTNNVRLVFGFDS